ncbi:MAG: 50S ribosomal protein L39e [Candidatus Brockarchaeota archaeon]|nr:50S ribosomal protein L39e [Candidatus Brockarchaeota archaeon]MBO3808544.1 50S ribosomal protein L39e [Candidatus Brockarchaeota archaeon]MBO3832550.1 50S ribosomal protein L39e [Candidatus Brockarchaeota archaeon]MBO3841510.1 50S ribosomal protein L39e [Candidatus Brockarchaeota archaeon]MCX8183224.1 50S ribosomal protein L39e [Thermoproteota archaeon]
MARSKTVGKKLRLQAELKRSYSVPTWVIAKTRGKVRFTHRWRNWRRSRIKL